MCVVCVCVCVCVEQILRKGKKKVKRDAPSVVAVRKGNSMGAGRPRGAGKGRYIAVDGRMKKELKAHKRSEKRKKQGRKK